MANAMHRLLAVRQNAVERARIALGIALRAAEEAASELHKIDALSGA
jgi:hypothetical protein